MAVRKKDAFTVVLEDINSRIKVVCEAQTGLRETMEAGFVAVDRRFEAVDRRFDAVDVRFEGLEGDLALVKAAVLENSRDLKELHVAVARKVDRDEVEAIVARAVGR